jgi:EmrB/QacA subfamily drug resistance transporter
MVAGSRKVHSRARWTLALTSVAFFMVALDSLVVVTAVPAIHREIGGSLGTLEWVVNAYMLTFAAGIVTAAALGDRLGRRRCYTAGLVLFAAASALCATAPGAELLIAARALQGLGAAIVTPLSLTLLTEAFPAQRRGAILGIWGGIAGLAIAAGPLVGGAVTQGLSWHWVFWVNVPIGLLTAVLSVVRLGESRGPARRLDGVGAVLVSLAALGVAWALVRAGDAGWSSREVELALASGAGLLAAFLVWERRVAAPMLPLGLFRVRAFAAANATGFLMNGAIFSAAFLVSQFFQLGLGYSPLATGTRFLPWTATPLLIAPLAGALSDRIGRRPPMVVGLALQAGGLVWLGALAGSGAGYAAYVLPLVVAGVGISMALPTTTAAALGTVAPAEIGIAAGVANTLQRFGGVFGVAVTSLVFSLNGHLGAPAAVAAGFRPAIAVSAGLSLAGAGAACAAGARRRRRPARELATAQLAANPS